MEDETPGAETVRRLADDVSKLIDYYAAEYRMPLASAIGVLQIKMHSLIRDAFDEEDDE